MGRLPAVEACQPAVHAQAAASAAEVGSGVRAIAAHPGYAATNLQFRESRLEDRMMAIGNRLIAQTDEAGARPILYAASQDLPGASYVGPDGLGEHRGYPTLVGRAAAASDVETAKRLWTLSEELTGSHAHACHPLIKPLCVPPPEHERRTHVVATSDLSTGALDRFPQIWRDTHDWGQSLRLTPCITPNRCRPRQSHGSGRQSGS